MSTRTRTEFDSLPIYQIVCDDANLVELERILNDYAQLGYRISAVLPAGYPGSDRAVIMERMESWDLTDQGREAVLEYPATVDSNSDIPF